MTIQLSAINYLAVVVAGFLAFMLGGLWYQALFGKLWLRLHGFSEEKVKEMQAKRPPTVFFSGMIACYLVVSFVMAILITSLSVTSALDGAVLGALVWLGPAAAIGMTGHLASDKDLGIYLIDVSFQLVFLLMMGAILGAWR